MKKLQVLMALALLVAAFSCDKSTSTNYLDQADCTGVDATTNSYTATIKGILDNSCATSGCHNASSHESGVDLSNYAKVKNAFQNADCLCTIHHGSTCNPMPRGGNKLGDATIQLIDCWAKNGYKE